VTITIKSGVGAKDYADIAKKENLDPLTLELRKVEDAVDRVMDEMNYMKTRGIHKHAHSLFSWP